MLGVPGPGQPRGRQAGPTGQCPPGWVKARPAALTRAGARPRHARGATRARTRGDGGGGARRGGEAGPEQGREGAHRDAEVAAKLTSGGAGEERRRTGGATSRGGGGRRRSSPALQGRGRGRVRGGTGRGKRGDAPPTKNRRGTHRERRISGEEGARAGGVNGGERARV